MISRFFFLVFKYFSRFRFFKSSKELDNLIEDEKPSSK